MAAQFGRSGDILAEHRDIPGVGTGAAVWFADVVGRRFAFFDCGAGAEFADDFGRAPHGHVFAFHGVAPAADDEFAVVAVGDTVGGKISPERADGRLIGIGKTVFRGYAAHGLAFRS